MTAYLIVPLGPSVVRAVGAVTIIFRAEQPIKLSLFIIVPRENDAFGFGEYLIDADQSLVGRSK